MSKFKYSIISSILCILLIFNAAGRHTSTFEPSNFEVIYPVKLLENGAISSDLDHQYSYYNNDSTIFYKIKIDDEVKLIVLEPNFNIISEDSVIEIIKESKTAKLIPNTKFKPIKKNYRCFYHGYILKEKNSRVALSTCNGLTGHIFLNGKTYYIKPIESKDQKYVGKNAHMLYEADKFYSHSFQHTYSNFCGVKDSAGRVKLEMPAMAKQNTFSRFHKEYFLQVTVVADKTMIDFHKNLDLEQYILTVFNMAHNLFHDDTLQVHINLSIVRIILLNADETAMNNKVDRIASNTLSEFCKWQKELNPREESHPFHHDLIVLLTRVDLCAGDGTKLGDCELLGLAYHGGTCDKNHMCLIAQDKGLVLGYVLAHEIGHTLGMSHDEANVNGCPSRLPDSSLTVMSPKLNMDVNGWSRCSNEYLLTFLDSNKGTCMEEKPMESKYKINNILPGALYDGTYQCRQYLNPGVTACQNDFSCNKLKCQLHSQDECLSLKAVPAPGTPCGEGKWCYKKKCLSIGQRPGAIDGQWSSWSPWSNCSRDCGNGVSKSIRTCNSPKPKNGGKYCLGERKRYKICETKPCTDRAALSFREEQCKAFNNATKSYKPFLFHPRIPCALVCMDEDLNKEKMAHTVLDGTECIQGENNMCIGGLCVAIPCDKNLNSTAITDVCGVCHGDGTTCHAMRDIVNIDSDKNPKLVLRVPKGAMNIIVEAMYPSQARLYLAAKGRSAKLNIGYTVVGDIRVWLGNKQPSQEIVSIKGPTSHDIEVLTLPNESVKYSYSMGLPAKKRKPVLSWEFNKWTDCTAECGTGSETAYAQCVEQDSGIIEDKHCLHLPKPDPKVRICEKKPC